MTHWFWLAFEDTGALPGTRARGALILRSDTDDEVAVLALAADVIRKGHLNPALLEYTVHLAEVEARHGAPDAGVVHRYLSNDEAALVARVWTGGVASARQIRAAFSDDEASRGEPLFRNEILGRPFPLKRGGA